jgi:hypothetical protein
MENKANYWTVHQIKQKWRFFSPSPTKYMDYYKVFGFPAKITLILFHLFICLVIVVQCISQLRNFCDHFHSMVEMERISLPAFTFRYDLLGNGEMNGHARGLLTNKMCNFFRKQEASIRISRDAVLFLLSPFLHERSRFCSICMWRSWEKLADNGKNFRTISELNVIVIFIWLALSDHFSDMRSKFEARGVSQVMQKRPNTWKLQLTNIE